MKQENKFVADLYHYLLPFIDKEKELYLCMDGGAAKHHAESEEGILKDPVLPDLWFALVGQDYHIGIEAKVFDGNNLSFRQCQIQSWKTGGNGTYCPKLWVATNRDQSEFSCWHHKDMKPRLDNTDNQGDNVSLSMANYTPAHKSNSVKKLALYILQNQVENA